MSYYPYYYYQQPYYGYPAYTYPEYSYNDPEQLYYPVDKYGQILGPPTRLPPLVQQHPSGYYQPYDHTANVITHGSPVPSPRVNAVPYSAYYYPQPVPVPVPVAVHNPAPVPVAIPNPAPPARVVSVSPAPASISSTLPPIKPAPLTSSRSIISNASKFRRYAVTDLTERSSVMSLSPRDAVRSVQYYDKLRRSNH